MMRRRQIILGAIFSIFLVVSTPVLATASERVNQAPNSDIIREDEVDQKELLFQTILDITNNNEIHKVILNSQIKGGMDRFFVPGIKFSVFTPHILTKKELSSLYNIGLILSKTLEKSQMHLVLERAHTNTLGMQRKITAVIEKNNKLNREIIQLSNSNCNCEDISGVTPWQFPVICTILGVIEVFFLFFASWLHIGNNILIIIQVLLEIFNCNGFL
jgi:hypothetical protein